MKKILGILLLSIFIPIVIFARTPKIGIWDPDRQTPFNIPAQLESTLKDYRKNWIRLTKVEFSGLHWNLGIVIYINSNYKVFAKNYIGYLIITEGLDEEEDCDPGEKYIEEQDECISIFSSYPVGTMVLKENYVLDNNIPISLHSITMMIKHEIGYDAEGGGWEFIQFGPSGNILNQGNGQDPQIVTSCAECHKNMVDRDFIFSSFYQPQQAPQVNQ